MNFNIGQGVTFVKKEIFNKNNRPNSKRKIIEYRDPAIVQEINLKTIRIRFTNGYSKCVKPSQLEPLN